MESTTKSPSSEFNDAASYLSNATSTKVPTSIKLEVSSSSQYLNPEILTVCSDLKQLYGLFKYITVSPTPTTPRPSIFDMTGRAKWDAWNSAGATFSRREEAEKRYTDIATTLGWVADSKVVRDFEPKNPPTEGVWKDDNDIQTSSSEGAGGMGVAVSVMTRPPDLKEESVHGMVISNDVQGLSLLLDENPGADLNGLDEFGYTPLHLASDRGHLSVVQVLLKNGADATIRDPDGFSASELAMIAGHDEIRNYLLSSHLKI